MFSVFVEKWEFQIISHDNTENQIFLPLQDLVFLLFTTLDFISITSHIHNWMLLWLRLVILSGYISPVAYWAPTDLGSSSFSVISFAFSYCSWGSQGKKTEVVCLCLFQWTTFCQNSPP